MTASGASIPASNQSLRLGRGRILSFASGPLVMGVVNVTPDSFSDGGVHLERGAAVAAALRMVEDGAAIVDLGGESTRPGAAPVVAEEELSRVVPVIGELRARSEVAISVDTRSAVVAAAALDAGADIINDVSALRHDPAMAATAVARKVPVILMHMRGEPATMQQLANYGDVVAEVAGELMGFRNGAIAAGVGPEDILVDPGIGFAKTFEHNLEILARCSELARIAPFVIGASRKAFIGRLTGREAGAARLAGSLAAVAAAQRGRAAIVRVHDVRETVDFLRVLSAIEESR